MTRWIGAVSGPKSHGSVKRLGGTERAAADVGRHYCDNRCLSLRGGEVGAEARSQ